MIKPQLLIVACRVRVMLAMVPVRFMILGAAQDASHGRLRPARLGKTDNSRVVFTTWQDGIKNLNFNYCKNACIHYP